MADQAQRIYEAPEINRVGSLSELTLSKQPKYFNQNSDYAYPNGYSFNFYPS